MGVGNTPSRSFGCCLPVHLRGAAKVAEIRGPQHHDVFHGTLDESLNTRNASEDSTRPLWEAGVLCATAVWWRPWSRRSAAGLLLLLVGQPHTTYHPPSQPPQPSSQPPQPQASPRHPPRLRRSRAVAVIITIARNMTARRMVHGWQAHRLLAQLTL